MPKHEQVFGGKRQMEAAVLFSEMTPAPEWEADFNAWYDEEHIPLRMAVPGFLGAQRYRRGALDYLAVYDMTDPAVLDSGAYKDVKDHPSEKTAWMLKSVANFTRYIGWPIATRAQQGCDDFVKGSRALSCLLHGSRRPACRLR
jgi:hypothetical protein